jgi:hypothetical protein
MAMDKEAEADARMMSVADAITKAIPDGTPVPMVLDALCLSVVLVAKTIARDTYQHEDDVLEHMINLIDAIYEEINPVDAIDTDAEEK